MYISAQAAHVNIFGQKTQGNRMKKLRPGWRKRLAEAIPIPACQRVADKIGKMGASAAMSYKAMALPGLAVGMAMAI